MSENGDTHRERVAVLNLDRQCTECGFGHRSVSVVTDEKGTRGVCGRCHVTFAQPKIAKNSLGRPAPWIEPN